MIMALRWVLTPRRVAILLIAEMRIEPTAPVGDRKPNQTCRKSKQKEKNSHFYNLMKKMLEV